MRLIVPLIFFVLFANSINAQTDSLFNRLSAIENDGTIHFNVDGINFSSQDMEFDYNKKGLRKAARRYKVKRKIERTSRPDLTYQHAIAQYPSEVVQNITAMNSVYFVKNREGKIKVVSFAYPDTAQPNFELKMINLIMNDEIPESVMQPQTATNVNFAGRGFELGGSCRWMNINSVQCPFNGQINWSVHSTLESARQAIEYQFSITDARKGYEIIADDQVNVLFEGVATTARKIVLYIKGVNSVLLSATGGGKHLIIYYVAEKIRGNYVSCVLSHWDNDNINPSGLPALLEQVLLLEAE